MIASCLYLFQYYWIFFYLIVCPCQFHQSSSQLFAIKLLFGFRIVGNHRLLQMTPHLLPASLVVMWVFRALLTHCLISLAHLWLISMHMKGYYRVCHRFVIFFQPNVFYFTVMIRYLMDPDPNLKLFCILYSVILFHGCCSCLIHLQHPFLQLFSVDVIFYW